MKHFIARIILPCLFFTWLFFLSSCATGSQAESTKLEKLSFTSTQTWSPRFLQWAETAIDAPEIALPAPPKNTSNAVKKDLATLHTYQKARTERNIREIMQEINIYDALFGEQAFGELVDESRRPLTFELIKAVIELESPQIMKQKKIYNRVRPSYLDPTLKPIIDIPPHPAYPSGHATQAYLRAYVLSELDPENRDVYVKAAKRIARNREVAGLHYPSDSKAGQMLAGQLFTKLMHSPEFAKHLKEAKTEW
jgi:hypothetical protein